MINNYWTRLSNISWFVSGKQINYLPKLNRQINDLRDTDKSRYFAITEFNNCLIMRLLSFKRSYSLWNLWYYSRLIKLQLHVQQISLPRIISNDSNNKNWLKKKNFSANKFTKTTIAICFNLLQVCPSVLPVTIAALFIPSFNVLSSYFYVPLNWWQFPLF